MNQSSTGQLDSNSDKKCLEELAFFASPTHDCSYLPDRSSVSLFADPNAPMDTQTYSTLLENGFRRSGTYVYRPHCPACRSCIAARIPVDQFQPNRSQKRCKRRNQHPDSKIEVNIVRPTLHEEHFRLYQKYISTRHTGGGMDDPSTDKYMDFLTCSWADTEFVEFRLNDQLVAVAIMDSLSHSLSSVYTFFDPDLAELSLGRFALLWQISEARQRRLPYLYLGYWIKDCKKMLYKQEYRPIELYQDYRWRKYDRNEELSPTFHP